MSVCVYIYIYENGGNWSLYFYTALRLRDLYRELKFHAKKEYGILSIYHWISFSLLTLLFPYLVESPNFSYRFFYSY